MVAVAVVIKEGERDEILTDGLYEKKTLPKRWQDGERPRIRVDSGNFWEGTNLSLPSQRAKPVIGRTDFRCGLSQRLPKVVSDDAAPAAKDWDHCSRFLDALQMYDNLPCRHAVASC